MSDDSASCDSSVPLQTIDPLHLLVACASTVPDDLSQHPLLVFHQHHTSASSLFSLAEHVAALSAASQLTLVAGLDECLLELLGRQQHTAAAASESQHTASLSLLDCIVTLLHACLPASSAAAASPLSAPLLSCLQQLHDALLTFQHTTAAHTQHRIATLLTTAYSTNPASLLSLLPFLLPYLLLKCLEPSVRRSDIVALHGLRGAFGHFDYADETSASLVQLLARAAVHPPLLRSREGRQLLAAVWSTSEVVGESMHAAVKEHCVTGRRSLLEHYGDVYYRVWKESAEASESRQQCEGWLQQLMHLCLHCSLPRTHQSLLQLLHVLHSHRKQRDVELLLARLYEPLLFRALSAAHPLLRLHALSVLVDVFPLASLDAEVPQETHIAQQMQALLSALSDAYAPSRAVAVRGICLLLSLYWELFCAEVKVDTVTAVLALREDMAASSRIAVCDGVRTLLSCHLSHQLLQPLLPSLTPLLHDRSDAVQSAFLSLLLAVKALRDIRFYHITPLPTLLLCLQHAAGSDKLAAKLRQLLSNSFWPDGGSSALLVRRLMVMVGENAVAARVFYGGSGSDASLDDKVRLAAGLVQLLFVSACTDDKENAQPGSGKANSKTGKAAQSQESQSSRRRGQHYRLGHDRGCSTTHRRARHTTGRDTRRHTRVTVATAAPRPGRRPRRAGRLRPAGRAAGCDLRSAAGRVRRPVGERAQRAVVDAATPAGRGDGQCGGVAGRIGCPAVAGWCGGVRTAARLLGAVGQGATAAAADHTRDAHSRPATPSGPPAPPNASV